MQQELMVPEPTRKIITRRGMTAHWGVDPSTQRVAIACGLQVRTHSFPHGDGLARLSTIYAGTREFVEDLLAEWPAPGFILMEQPSGQHVDPILWYAVGTMIAAIQDATSDYGTRVETITPSSWKKTAVGSGAIYKPTTKKLGRRPEYLDYGVARWAAETGYTGHSWDEADALGIAEAARRTVWLEAR